MSSYYNAAQLRSDLWHRLRTLTERVDNAEAAHADRDRLRADIAASLERLEPIELYWAFPGKAALADIRDLFRRREHGDLKRLTANIVRALASEAYRHRLTSEILRSDPEDIDIDEAEDAKKTGELTGYKPYFEVLIVDALGPREETMMREGLRAMRRAEDAFLYDTVVVPSFEDAIIAVMFNYNIQAVIVRYSFGHKSRNRLDLLNRYLSGIDEKDLVIDGDEDLGIKLGRVLAEARPELDLYLVADASVEDVAGAAAFRRVFYRQDDYLELHLSILRGINRRYETPFFAALKEYSKQPTGAFHALPISRGTSVVKSHWIKDMAQFYGTNIFLAETSATTGGLDSLLNPLGPIKKAQELAAVTFGADRTFFVTNGTSTANKIVVQAILRPGDIVLVDRDCHKSHHYGLVLSGAQVSYLDSYPLPQYWMYGAVPLRDITRRLLDYQTAGLLDRVRMLLLTNCTFDGIVYNVERVMEACLAIKPDLIFLWDEAWFAFASFHPTYRQRTAMRVAAKLRQRYRSAAYRARYVAWRDGHPDEAARDAARAAGEGLPDPDRARIRVYATQSTHKTLTAFRQASMIHVHDQDFQGKVATAFHEAYMTHTSTSPNYQLLASLDIGRRQMALEGYELVQKQLERAMILRERVKEIPIVAKYLRFLSMRDMIPADYRGSGIEVYYDPDAGWLGMEDAWESDEFALDPTRLTMFTGSTGIDGFNFRGDVLMNRYAIQINKTSRNTVLFMTNIGTTRSAVAYLLKSLVNFCEGLDRELDSASRIERAQHDKRVRALTSDVPDLPHFSGFHPAFQVFNNQSAQDGDIRSAYFRGYEDDDCDYLDIESMTESDIDLLDGAAVSAMFVIPYPPGFPVLVPGQIISPDIVRFLRKVDVKEIHGYKPELGLRVFKPSVLADR
ncbi:MAG: aminotransferase class I/II-fold pyridoxal phosphate-dependent enzyme [Dongiaceae bacterium]